MNKCGCDCLYCERCARQMRDLTILFAVIFGAGIIGAFFFWQ